MLSYGNGKFAIQSISTEAADKKKVIETRVRFPAGEDNIFLQFLHWDFLEMTTVLKLFQNLDRNKKKLKSKVV